MTTDSFNPRDTLHEYIVNHLGVDIQFAPLILDLLNLVPQVFPDVNHDSVAVCSGNNDDVPSATVIFPLKDQISSLTFYLQEGSSIGTWIVVTATRQEDLVTDQWLDFVGWVSEVRGVMDELPDMNPPQPIQVDDPLWKEAIQETLDNNPQFALAVRGTYAAWLEGNRTVGATARRTALIRAKHMYDQAFTGDPALKVTWLEQAYAMFGQHGASKDQAYVGASLAEEILPDDPAKSKVIAKAAILVLNEDEDAHAAKIIQANRVLEQLPPYLQDDIEVVGDSNHDSLLGLDDDYDYFNDDDILF